MPPSRENSQSSYKHLKPGGVAGNSGSSHSHNDLTGSVVSGGAPGIGLNMGIGSSLGHLGGSNVLGGGASVSGSVAGNSNANSSNL